MTTETLRHRENTGRFTKRISLCLSVSVVQLDLSHLWRFSQSPSIIRRRIFRFGPENPGSNSFFGFFADLALHFQDFAEQRDRLLESLPF